MQSNAPDTASAWHAMSEDEALAALASSRASGLSAAEAARRLGLWGPNLPPQSAGPSPWRLLLGQFQSLLVYILLVAAGVSLALGDQIEAGAIVAIVLLNGALGFFQEYRAHKALQALRSMVSPQATVLREGSQSRVQVADLVPGDVVLLESGDVVSVDGRLLDGIALQVSEALLTGESAPVDKSAQAVAADTPLAERTSTVYQGTQVVRGRGLCVAFATGANSEMGRIAGLIAESPDQETPLQRRLTDVGRFLVGGALALCLAVFVVGVLRGIAADRMFLVAASLAVAAIPEGLAAATTVVLALGVQRMARRNVIVRRLSSVETLGAVSVIFTDKTGTLTQNRMAVEAFWAPDNGHAAREALVLCNNAVLSNDGDNHIGDPTEVALLAYARDAGLDPLAISRANQRLRELPFEPARARMTVVIKSADGRLEAITKGAPEVVLPLCRPEARAGGSPLLDEARRQVSVMAAAGLRVLAVAAREVEDSDGEIEQGLRLLGLAGLGDPPRADAAASIELARRSGVRVVMLTGDHATTAAAIGHQLGLTGEVLTGRDLETRPDGAGADLKRGEIFARVTSEDKLNVVRAAREAGEVTAMTGDGVNDAPALRAADIGIAMGIGGTDVAREAADMVLLDNSLASVVSAIEEGRSIYANIQRFVHFLLSCNLAEVSVIFLALLFWSESLFTPLQILFVNFLTDGLPALALGLEPADPEAMRRPPRRAESRIISPRSLTPILAVGGVVSACTLAALALGHAWGGADLGNDMALATLVGAHLAAAFVFRNEKRGVFQLRRNNWLVVAVASSALLLVAVYRIPAFHGQFDVAPLSVAQTLVVIGLSTLPLVLGEIAKLTRLVERLGLLPPDYG